VSTTAARFGTPVPAWVWLVAVTAWPAVGVAILVVVARESDPGVLAGAAAFFAALGLAIVGYARWVAVIVEEDVLRLRPGGPRSLRIPVEEVTEVRVLRTRSEVRRVRNDLFFAALRRHLPVWADRAVLFTAPYRPGAERKPHALYCDDVDALAELLGGEQPAPPPGGDAGRDLGATPRDGSDPAGPRPGVHLMAAHQRTFPDARPEAAAPPPAVPAPPTPFTSRSSVPWWVWTRTVVLWGLGLWLLVLFLFLPVLPPVAHLVLVIGLALLGVLRLRRHHPATVVVDADGIDVRRHGMAVPRDEIIDVIPLEGRAAIRQARRGTTAPRARQRLPSWGRRAVLITSAPGRHPLAPRTQHLLVCDDSHGLVETLGGARTVGPTGTTLPGVS
jgi:hypothetical protein